MPNPLRQLKTLPWRSLFLVALFTLAIVTLIDWLLVWGYIHEASVKQALNFFLVPNQGWILLISMVVGLGIGALALVILERWFQRQIYPYLSTLWALVLCLIVCLWVKSLLPIPGLLVDLSETQAIGIVIGVFWKGQPYWR